MTVQSLLFRNLMVWGLTSINHLTHPTWLPSKRPPLNTTTSATVSWFMEEVGTPGQKATQRVGGRMERGEVLLMQSEESPSMRAEKLQPRVSDLDMVFTHPVENVYNYILQVSLWLFKNMIASCLDVYEGKRMNWIDFYFIRED